MAPDNGVLTAVLKETPPRKVVELSERRFARPTVTRTFEGRDRFGNLVTNIDRRTFETFARPSPIRILAAGRAIDRLVSTYAEIAAGEVCALFGSSDHLELAANSASAAAQLGLDRGAAVEIRRS